MLATAVYFPEPDSVPRRISDLRVFIDTPLLIRGLGYAEGAAKDAALSLMQAMRELGSQICCYTHTFQEVQNIMESCAHNLSRPQSRYRERTPSALEEYCVSPGIKAGDLDLAAEKLE